jgi:hypothetical protein
MKAEKVYNPTQLEFIDAFAKCMGMSREEALRYIAMRFIDDMIRSKWLTKARKQL